MLAREGTIRNGDTILCRTPLLVPSFSSKGFPELRKILDLMSEFITESALVSAYDEHYGHIKSKALTFPSVIFLDSGGYEARVEHDLSEAYGQDYRPSKWTLKQHQQVLDGWSAPRPTIVISFDSPRRHSVIEKQIESALQLKAKYPNFVHEFLIKPEKNNELIKVDAVERVVGSLHQFAAIGVTEREIDNKLIGRMEKIAHIRRLLDSDGVTAPLHIFGSLDTFSTPLYFLSGAEIFDGLTWLRFGYHEGQTVYRQNYGAMRGSNGILKDARELSHAMWKDNHYYLESLRDQMRNFVHSGNYETFEHIGDQLKHAVQQLESRVPA